MWDFLKGTLEQVLGKLIKTEFWIAGAGIAAAWLAPKMNLPEEQLLALLGAISAIVVTYISQRGYVKGKEAIGPANPTP